MDETIIAPKAFVNRKQEIALAEKRFEELLTQKTTGKPVLFFYGVPLVGKTTLLKEMLRRAAKRGIPTAEIDFAAQVRANGNNGHKVSGVYGGEQGKVKLAMELLRQLERTADAPAFSRIDLEKDRPNQAATKIVQQISRLHRGAYNKPVALFFDTLEDVPPDVFSWLQEQILKPALEEGELFVVLGARAHYRALRLDVIWPVLRQMVIHQLNPFNQEDTRVQFRHLGQELSEDFIDYTGGIPGVNEKVVAEKYYREKTSLPGKIVNEIIFEYVAKKVKEVEEVLLVIAAFRWFSDRLLGRVGHHFWPEKYAGNRRAGNRLARELLDSMLVEERSETYGYVVVPQLRRVLDRYQRLERPEQHLETHALAFGWFEEEVAAGDWISLVDQVYHLVAAWYDLDHREELSSPEEIPYPTAGGRVETLQDLLRRGLEKLTDEDRDRVNLERMTRAFATSEEFRWFMDDAEIQALVAFCKRYNDRELLSPERA